MNHSQSFVQAGTCSPLSAPWLRVVTANRNTQAQLHISTTYHTFPCCNLSPASTNKMVRWITIHQKGLTIWFALFFPVTVSKGEPSRLLVCHVHDRYTEFATCSCENDQQRLSGFHGYMTRTGRAGGRWHAEINKSREATRLKSRQT